MSYISSDNILVFPSSKRGVKYTESRLTTEASFVNIVNKLIDTEGFVITNEYSKTLPFEFNIYGYYFRVEAGQYITQSFSSPTEGQVIYGLILIEKVGDNYELYGQDLDLSYQGISFVTELPTDTGSRIPKFLPLLKFTKGSWQIVPDSLIKFTQKSLRYVVDGGQI